MCTRNFIQVVFPARRNRHQVPRGLQKCYTRLRHLGFCPSRFHSDRGKEIISEPVARWALARDMWKTTTSGDDPAANGKVERAVGLFKEGCRQLLRAAQLEPCFWPLAARHWAGAGLGRQARLLELRCLSWFRLGRVSWRENVLGIWVPGARVYALLVFLGRLQTCRQVTWCYLITLRMEKSY